MTARPDPAIIRRVAAAILATVADMIFDIRYWFDITRPYRDVRIRFHDDGCVLMNDDQWGRWINRLPVNEFLVLMLQSPPDADDEARAAREEARG